MKNNLSMLATLALAAALLPAAFAQQDQSTQPKSDQTQSQPGSDQPQSQTTPALDRVASTSSRFRLPLDLRPPCSLSRCNLTASRC